MENKQNTPFSKNEMKQLYEKICEEIDHLEPWKKKYYNDTFAISPHSKKLKIDP